MTLDLGVVGSALLVAWAAVAAARRATKRRSLLLGALAGGGVLALVPVDGLPILGYVRAHVGDLSAPSQILLGLGIARRLELAPHAAARDLDALSGGAIAAGLVLYPSALGLFPLDAYALGYGATGLVLAAGAAGLACWRFRLPFSLGSIVAALAGYGFTLGESPNLWDYLLDPWLFLFACTRSARRIYENRRGLQQQVNAHVAAREGPHP